MERPYGDKLKGIGVWPGGGGDSRGDKLLFP